MTTLRAKERYVIHYRALKQALTHGLHLKTIHRVLKFNQSPWLEKYIDLNGEKHKNAKNGFKNMLFKLFNNAVYGKTMENERKRNGVKLISGTDTMVLRHLSLAQISIAAIFSMINL